MTPSKSTLDERLILTLTLSATPRMTGHSCWHHQTIWIEAPWDNKRTIYQCYEQYNRYESQGITHPLQPAVVLTLDLQLQIVGVQAHHPPVAQVLHTSTSSTKNKNKRKFEIAWGAYVQTHEMWVFLLMQQDDDLSTNSNVNTSQKNDKIQNLPQFAIRWRCHSALGMTSPTELEPDNIRLAHKRQSLKSSRQSITFTRNQTCPHCNLNFIQVIVWNWKIKVWASSTTKQWMAIHDWKQKHKHTAYQQPWSL